MGHQKNKGMIRSSGRPTSRRRGYIPEPCDITRPTDHSYQVGYFHEIRDRNRRGRRDKSFNFTHTSCIMAIRNYVERMQNTRQRKKKNIASKDNAEKLICSLKNDIQMISKYEEEAAINPGKQPSSDPYFVLSAMMCKINKLENILLAQPDCREQLAKRKDMIMMARCIKKTLLEQAQCDEQLLQEKQKKMICLVRSLDMFERDIRCATRGIKKLCCSKTGELHDGGNCSCTNKEKCAQECPGKACDDGVKRTKSRSPSPSKENKDFNVVSKVPCPDTCDPIRDACQKYDITGMKVTYTKSHVQKSPCGEKESIRNRVSCEMNEDENCKVTVMKEGGTTSSDDCNNPIIKQKMNSLGKIWMESARQLIDACSTY